MAEFQKKITNATYNSLKEFSAIPVKIRREYLDKFLKRKNSTSQKNTKLLLYIYNKIDNDKISEWNPDDIRRSLQISEGALYRQKSRLLQSLKLFYAGWNNKKVETLLNIQYPKSMYNDTERYFRINMDKALKLYDTGLRKEAKELFLMIEKKLLAFNANDKYKYYTLSHIYERLTIYYSLSSNIPKTFYYNNLLKKSAGKALEHDLTEKEETYLKIWKNYSSHMTDRNIFHKNNKSAKIHFYLKKVYRDALKIDAHEYILRVLSGLASIESDLKNFSRSEFYSRKGYDYSSRIGNVDSRHYFAGLLYVAKAHQKKEFLESTSEEIIEYYKKLKKENPLSIWALYLEHTCADICSIENIGSASEFYKARVNSSILSGGFVYAASLLFYIEFEEHIKMYRTSFIKNEDDLLCRSKIEKHLLDKAENTCLNTLNYSRAIKDMGFIWDVYLLQLITSVFKEEDFDYERSLLIINKMERVKKSKKKTSALGSFEIIKLCCQLLENSDDIQALEKYSYSLKKMIDGLKKENFEFDLIDYAIISSLARRLRCREITAIVKDLYHWLEANHPEILAPALREIEERASKVKLIDGSKMSAA